MAGQQASLDPHEGPRGLMLGGVPRSPPTLRGSAQLSGTGPPYEPKSSAVATSPAPVNPKRWIRAAMTVSPAVAHIRARSCSARRLPESAACRYKSSALARSPASARRRARSHHALLSPRPAACSYKASAPGPSPASSLNLARFRSAWGSRGRRPGRPTIRRRPELRRLPVARPNATVLRCCRVRQPERPRPRRTSPRNRASRPTPSGGDRVHPPGVNGSAGGPAPKK